MPAVNASPLSMVRSLLFVPGDDEAKLARAAQRGADALIIDLEDAVAPARKPLARELTVRMLAALPPEPLRLVRVNAAGGPALEEDLLALRDAPHDGLVLPKATPGALELLEAGGLPVVAIVESAIGLRDARALAEHPRVGALMLGSVDLSADLGLTPRADGLELLHARSTLVLESAAAAIRAPFDGVHVDVADLEGLAAQARLARSLGMGGKACIHPAQIAVVHEAFTPDERELAWAQRVLEVAAADPGVATLDGTMVDAAVVARARRILAERPRH